MTVLLLLALLVLHGDREAAVGWEKTADAEIAIVHLPSAPFPHPSRLEGYKNSKGEFFPADPHYIDDSVGIVIPQGFRPDATVDFVVHFHGHRNNVANVLGQFDLPAELHRSKVNAILIVPQLARDAPDEGAGKLEDENGFQAMMLDIAALLKKEHKTGTTAIGRIVITAHSGGYWPAAVSLAKGAMADHITDVILLDATYGGLADFASFAAADDHRLVSIFTSHLADRNFMLMTLLHDRNIPFDLLMDSDLSKKRLDARQPIFIHTRDLGHNELVSKRNYFSMLLATSALAR